MSTDARVNLDTSVLVNYLYASLPGELERPRGSVAIIEDESVTTAIGGKATEEFEALCERRYELYADVVDFLLDTDDSIFDYDPIDRDIHTSSNDKRHLRNSVQMSWHDRDRREQLSLLRRINQEVELYQVRIPTDIIDERFGRRRNDVLLERFETELDIDHDRDILVDAVEIARDEAITLLLALDSDLTHEDHRKVLADILDEIFGDSELLRVESAETYTTS